MTHPDWVLKFKVKNTEIRLVKGRYYLYDITSVWCPEKKRTKKVTLKYVGSIDEEYGLIPAGMKRRGKVPQGESPFKVQPKEECNFLDKFENIEDPRSNRNQLHSVAEILLVTLCAVICGADGWQDVENFGKSKINYLRCYLDYNNGVPSDDTIRRFYRNINPLEFEKLFREWVGTLAKGADIKVIAIDGKSSRHSFDGEGNMLHVVSAFATEARIVLGQEKVDEKSNEITAIPKMLAWLDVRGHIITVDAMGCQHAIADQITQKEGDYIFSLKGNQGTLSDNVQLYFEDKKLDITSHCIDYDKGHGRIDTRECWVVSDTEWLRELHPNWQTINSIIRIESTREMKFKGYKYRPMYENAAVLEMEEIGFALKKDELFLHIQGTEPVLVSPKAADEGIDLALYDKIKEALLAKSATLDLTSDDKNRVANFMSKNRLTHYTLSKESRYYISSLKDFTAERMLKAIRSHWGIENTLHWVLDMSFNEDYSRIRKENAPHVMAIIRHIALNLLQQAKTARQSIKGLRKMAGWDDDTLDLVISKKSS
jgi:predicted transposase YbfD/YdcC